MSYRSGARRCLDALIAQRIEPDAFEIIVVDAGHADGVRDVVLAISAWIQAPRVRYLRPLHGEGPAAARNHGWRAARGSLIAFTEDDAIPAPDWLAAGARAFDANRHWLALSGDIVAAGPLPERSADGRATTSHESDELLMANAFVWRTALESVGGFDEQFTRVRRAASDLHFRLLALGGAVGRCPDAKVAYPARAESWRSGLRQQRDTYFDALLYKKHPRLYRQRIRRTPPWSYYTIVVLGVVTPLLLAVHEPLGALLSALAVAALVLGVASTRLQSADRSPRRMLETVVAAALIPFLSVYWRLRGAFRFKVLFL